MVNAEDPKNPFALDAWLLAQLPKEEGGAGMSEEEADAAAKWFAEKKGEQ